MPSPEILHDIARDNTRQKQWQIKNFQDQGVTNPDFGAKTDSSVKNCMKMKETESGACFPSAANGQDARMLAQPIQFEPSCCVVSLNMFPIGFFIYGRTLH